MATLFETLKLKQQELAAKRGRDKTEKFPNGVSRWRILPHWSGDGESLLPSHDYGKHFIKDFSGEIKAVYICTAKTFARPCPICDAITKAEMAVSDEATSNLLSAAKAGQRYLVNAVRKTDKGYDPDPVLMELPGTVFDEMVNLAFQYVSDGINIFSMDEGFDLIVRREGAGLKTKYKAMLAPKSNPIDPGYLTKAVNLDQYVTQEYEEGKTKALVALANLAGSTTPMLPSAVSAPATVAVIGSAVASSRSFASEPEADLEVDLGEVELSDLDLDSLDD